MAYSGNSEDWSVTAAWLCGQSWTWWNHRMSVASERSGRSVQLLLVQRGRQGPERIRDCPKVMPW